MPHYFFHFRNGDTLEVDMEGMDLPDIDTAHMVALRMARELWGEVQGYGSDTAIEISDETGLIVLRVLFSEAIRIH